MGAIDKKTASREQVIASKELLIKKYNCKYLENWAVFSYTLKTQSSDIKEEDAIISVNRNLLSDKVNAIIQSLSKNDVITFDDIKAVGSDSRVVMLRPISIIIQ